MKSKSFETKQSLQFKDKKLNFNQKSVDFWILSKNLEMKVDEWKQNIKQKFNLLKFKQKRKNDFDLKINHLHDSHQWNLKNNIFWIKFDFLSQETT